MWPSWTPIVDDERKNDRTRSRFPVSNVFTPESRPNSVTAKAIRGSTLVAAAVSCAAANLIGAMIGRGKAHPRRQRERLFGARCAQEAHSFVYRAQSLFHPPCHSSWKKHEAAIVARAQLLNIRRVKSGVFSRNVDLPNDGAACIAFVFVCRDTADRKRAEGDRLDKAHLERKFDTPGHGP